MFKFHRQMRIAAAVVSVLSIVFQSLGLALFGLFLFFESFCLSLIKIEKLIEDAEEELDEEAKDNAVHKE